MKENLLESVQAEGGDNHFRPEFWQELRRLCDQYHIMLMADEIQVGMGMTGKMWAFQHYGVIPDIIAFGKKSQVCGILVTSRVDEVKDNVFNTPSRLSSTWGGSLSDMVRGQRFIEIIEEDRLVENSATVGGYFQERLVELSKKYPIITNVRGKGLLVAMDLPTKAHLERLKALAYERGAVIFGCGASSVRFRPFLDTSKQDVDKIMKILGDSFAVLASSKL